MFLQAVHQKLNTFLPERKQAHLRFPTRLQLPHPRELRLRAAAAAAHVLHGASGGVLDLPFAAAGGDAVSPVLERRGHPADPGRRRCGPRDRRDEHQRQRAAHVGEADGEDLSRAASASRGARVRHGRATHLSTQASSRSGDVGEHLHEPVGERLWRLDARDVPALPYIG